MMLPNHAILRLRCSFDFKTSLKCVSVSHQDISITLDEGKISARCSSSSLEKFFFEASGGLQEGTPISANQL